MDRPAAESFGKPTQWLADASQISAQGSPAERLGDAVTRVAGVAFTHEHVDHTEGAIDLCRLHPEPIPMFRDRLWLEESNFTTRPGLAILGEAKCLAGKEASGGPLFPVPGFPGLSFFAAAGHTPGSQVFIAHVRSSDSVRTWVMLGDVVNQIDGVRQNLPKPRLYSLLIVPESTARLDVLRRFLASLEREHGVTLLVSHDQLALEASGLPAF
jgi:glyoxylase-like metal-dependent hydrolase (beta-lactamase superfamily II)